MSREKVTWIKPVAEVSLEDLSVKDQGFRELVDVQGQVSRAIDYLQPIVDKLSQLKDKRDTLRQTRARMLDEQFRSEDNTRRNWIAGNGLPDSVRQSYLVKIGDKLDKFVVQLGIIYDEGVINLTVHTRTGRTIKRQFPEQELKSVFPSLKFDDSGNLVDQLGAKIQRCQGFAIPFEKGQKFHFLEGAKLSDASLYRFHLIDSEVKKIHTDKSPRLTQIEAQVKKLDSRIKRYQAMHRHELDMYADYVRGLEVVKDSVSLSLNAEAVVVKKVANPFRADGLKDSIYILMVNGQPIIRYKGAGKFEFVASRSQKSPFKVEPSIFADYLMHNRIESLKRFAGLQAGDFCTIKGIKITGEANLIITDLYTHIAKGIELLPKTIESYTRVWSNQGKASKVESRHWGQEFIDSFLPDEVIPGNFFSTGAWKLYIFKDKNRVIAESDHTGKATYIGTLDALNDFRAMGRTEILTQRPKSFLTRLVHKGKTEAEQQNWKEELRKYLDKDVT